MRTRPRIAMLLASALTLAGVGVCIHEPCAAAPPASQAEQPSPGKRLEPKQFAFDSGFLGAPGLEFSFVRGQEIIWSGQQAYGPNQPRYDAPLALAPAPRVEVVRPTANNTEIMASGLDHDGVTPILVLYDRSDRLLDVFTVAGDDLLDAEQTGVGRNRTDLGGYGVADLSDGAVAKRAHEPICAVVCHGLIVVQCVVWENLWDVGHYWKSVATSFFVSQDAGQTWELFHEDSAVEKYWDRGQEWAMQNWWPMQRGAPPVEAFFASADYRHNPGAHGGRSYLFRAQRTGVGSAWTLEPVLVAYESDGIINEHFHTAAAVPLPGSGLGVLTAVGDSQPRNRIISQTRPDRDYLSDGWKTDQHFHGRRARDTEIDPRQTQGLLIEKPIGWDVSKEGNQFVGCAPGRYSGDILVGGDLTSDQIMRFEAADLLEDHPTTEHVYGLDLASGSTRSEVFFIRTPTPEYGGPYIARYSPLSNAGNVPARAKRLLYSADGDAWTQVWQPNQGGFHSALHGDHIYIDSFLNSTGVRRIGIPSPIVRQPLRIGPGGMQRAVAEPSFLSGPHGSVTPLQRNPDGQWEFEGEVLDPQPPVSGQVYHVTSSAYDAGMVAGRVKVCGPAVNVGSIIPGSALQVHCWVMNNSREVSLHPIVEMRDQIGQVLVAQRPIFASVDRWFPITGIRHAPVNDGVQVYLRLVTSSSDIPDDSDFFLAIESVVEGVGCADYALPLDDSPEYSGRWTPDEIASVVGFDCGDQWTVTLAGQLPLDAWDATVETTDVWPLATIWGDNENYIELSATTADPEDCRLVASIVREGIEVACLESEPTYWLRGSALLVSLAEPGDGSGVQMTLSVANAGAQEATVVGGGGSASLLVAPTEIRFSSHHGTSGDGMEAHVSPMLWWGGEIAEEVFRDAAARTAQLETLDFLGEGRSRGDLDGDGDVDQSDLAILLASYEIDGGGDVDGDGDTDQADMGILLSHYGFGM